MSTNRVCPHPTCVREIDIAMFACRDHWHSLPRRMKDRINDAYRALRRTSSATSMGELVMAQKEAIDWWELR